MPALVTLTDNSLPTLYDCALAGVGYRVAWEIAKLLHFKHGPYLEIAHDIVVEKTDFNVEEMTENKLDLLYWQSQRSWHNGAGQIRFNVPKSSDPYAYLSSFNVDVRVPGQAFLLPDVASLSISGSSLGPYSKLCVGGGFLYQEDTGGNSWNRITVPATDSGSATSTSVTAGTGGVVECCSDGQNAYFADPNAVTPQIRQLTPTSAVAATFSSTAFGTGTAAVDARSMAWVKQRLVFAGVQSGTFGTTAAVWRIAQVASTGGTASEIALLPAGYSVPRFGIVELAGFVLIAAVSDHQSVIYAWDQFTSPYVVAELPEGDQITSMESFLGTEVCIGCRRLKSSAGVGSGVLYVGAATGAGQLVLSEVVELTDKGQPYPIGFPTDANDYAIVGMASRGKYTYFSWQPFGLGVYDHANQAYSRYIGNLNPTGTPPQTGVEIGDVVVVKRRLVFSRTSDHRSYLEYINKRVASGQIVGSVMDWNIDKAKTVNQFEFGMLPLPAGTSISMDYSTDNAATWTNVLADTTTGDTLASTTSTVSTQFQVNAQAINYRITMNSDGTATLTPRLKKAGFGAWYGSKPKKEWTVAIDVSDRLTNKNGSPFRLIGGSTAITGPNPQLWDLILANIRTLRDNQTIVSWQPPGYGDTHNEVWVVQVRGFDTYRWYEPQSGFGGIIMLSLKEAP
jgi:hypothetical protein